MPPRLAMKDHRLFFFDAETGGLDCRRHDMIEVACIVTDPSGRDVLAEYSAKVRPERPVDEEAARINGYSAEKWACEAIQPGNAMDRMLDMARDSVFVAHNAPFDWGFFEPAMHARGRKWRGSYHKIDTCALAMPLLKTGLVADLKLATLVSFFGGRQESAHSALSDVRDCRMIYLAMMERYAAVVWPRAAGA